LSVAQCDVSSAASVVLEAHKSARIVGGWGSAPYPKENSRRSPDPLIVWRGASPFPNPTPRASSVYDASIFASSTPVLARRAPIKRFAQGRQNPKAGPESIRRIQRLNAHNDATTEKIPTDWRLEKAQRKKRLWLSSRPILLYSDWLLLTWIEANYDIARPPLRIVYERLILNNWLIVFFTYNQFFSRFLHSVLTRLMDSLIVVIVLNVGLLLLSKVNQGHTY